MSVSVPSDLLVMKRGPVMKRRESYSDSNFTSRMVGSLTSRLLITEDEVNDARRLLYHVYIEEVEWDIPNDSPTGFKIVESASGKMLTDNWDPYAVWFGAYHKDKLIACIRLLRQDSRGGLDMLSYKQHQSEDIQRSLDDINHCNTMECQRSATLRSHRHFGAISLLVFAVVEYAQATNADLITTTGLTWMAEKNYSYTGATSLVKGFDYGDGMKTMMLHFKHDILPNTLAIMEWYITRQQERNQSKRRYVVSSRL